MLFTIPFSPDPLDLNSPVAPKLTYSNLSNDDVIKIIDSELRGKSGIYGIRCDVTNEQYIGSAENLFKRLKEHLFSDKSNVRLKRAINKYGLNNFSFLIYEFYDYPEQLLSNNIAPITLTQLETAYIKAFDFDTLYNFKQEANSMIGYKHTAEAIAKMIERFQDKTNHPMYGKKHTPSALAKISKPGALNPRYGVKLSQETKNLISKAMSKRPVYIYDLEGNLVNQ